MNIAMVLSLCLLFFCGTSSGATKKRVNLKPLNVTAENPNAAFHLLKKKPGNKMEKKFSNRVQSNSSMPNLSCEEKKMGGNGNNPAISCSRNLTE